MSVCPMISKKNQHKIDNIMKSIKKQLKSDGITKTSGGKTRRKRGGEGIALAITLMYLVVVLHQYYENPVKNMSDARRCLGSIMELEKGRNIKLFTLLFRNPLYLVVLFDYYNERRLESNVAPELITAIVESVTNSDQNDLGILNEMIENISDDVIQEIENDRDENFDEIPQSTARFTSTIRNRKNKSVNQNVDEIPNPINNRNRWTQTGFMQYEPILQKQTAGRRSSTRSRRSRRSRRY